MIDISLITPVYKKSHITLNFLNSVIPYLEINNAEIVIIDNGSRKDDLYDNTEEIVNFCRNQCEYYIRYVKCNKNHGFSGGNNIGVENARSERLLFISNDVIALSDFIAPTIKRLKEIKESNEKTILGGRLINFKTSWNDIFNEIEMIPYLEGWCVACNLDDFRYIGKWDERLWLDYEDLLFSYNATCLGYKLEEINSDKLRHLGGQTAMSLPGGRLVHTLESQKKFAEITGLTIRK